MTYEIYFGQSLSVKKMSFVSVTLHYCIFKCLPILENKCKNELRKLHKNLYCIENGSLEEYYHYIIIKKRPSQILSRTIFTGI